MEIRYFIKPTHLVGMDVFGWGNGYVVLPKDHPWYGKDYDDIDCDVHGGLTFGEPADKLTKWEQITKEDAGKWVIGFDTAHYQDSLERWPKEAVEKETQRLAKQAEDVFK